jgi:hypothetical protein
LERVATCFWGLRHDARKASCFKSSPEMTPQKAGRMTQTSKHGLRSHRNYYMPSNLAEAMIRLLDDSSNEGLTLLNQTLRKGEHVLGSMWTEQLSPADEQDLLTVNQVLPGLTAHFRPAQKAQERNSPLWLTPSSLKAR